MGASGKDQGACAVRRSHEDRRSEGNVEGSRFGAAKWRDARNCETCGCLVIRDSRAGSGRQVDKGIRRGVGGAVHTVRETIYVLTAGSSSDGPGQRNGMRKREC